MITTRGIGFFEQMGCKFVALNGKTPARADWQRRPLSADEIAIWRGSIGVLCGQVSGGICWLDVDYDAMTFLQRYRTLLHSLIVWRPECNDHCKVAVRLTDTASYWIEFRNGCALSLLGDGFHAAVIGDYIHNSRQPIPLSKIGLNTLWLDWKNYLHGTRTDPPRILF